MDTEVILTNNNSSIKTLLTQKRYLLYLIASCISRFGDSLDSIAYGVLVYTLTGSKVLMGTIFAINFIPNIIFGLPSGIIIDRFSKKLFTVLCDLGRAVTVLITALLFFFGQLEVWHLFLFTFINSTFETFANPARTSLITNLLHKDFYMSGSSLLKSGTSFSELLGLGCAGFIIGIFGISGAIGIDAITFFLSACLINFINLNEVKNKNSKLNKENFINDFKEGFAFLRSNTFLVIIILLTAFINFSLAPFNVLQYPYVAEILKQGPEFISFIGVGMLVGTIIGGFVTARFGNKFKKNILITFGFTLLGLCYASYGIIGLLISNSVWKLVVVILVSFCMGFGISISVSIITTYFMETTPKNIIGRISSIMNMLVLCALPLGSALTGIVAEIVPMNFLFVIMGIILSFVAICINFNKNFKQQ